MFISGKVNNFRFINNVRKVEKYVYTRSESFGLFFCDVNSEVDIMVFVNIARTIFENLSSSFRQFFNGYQQAFQRVFKDSSGKAFHF